MKQFATVLILAVLALPLLPAQTATPRLTAVTPDTGKAAASFAADGENLGKTEVAELYLTDGKNDIKVEVLEQAAASIKFKVPDGVKAGRYSLMILTSDRKRFMEQPVKLTIE